MNGTDHVADALAMLNSAERAIYKEEAEADAAIAIGHALLAVHCELVKLNAKEGRTGA
jgi:hypothetical protein